MTAFVGNTGLRLSSYPLAWRPPPQNDGTRREKFSMPQAIVTKRKTPIDSTRLPACASLILRNKQKGARVGRVALGLCPTWAWLTLTEWSSGNDELTQVSYNGARRHHGDQHAVNFDPRFGMGPLWLGSPCYGWWLGTSWMASRLGLWRNASRVGLPRNASRLGLWSLGLWPMGLWRRARRFGTWRGDNWMRLLWFGLSLLRLWRRVRHLRFGLWQRVWRLWFGLWQRVRHLWFGLPVLQLWQWVRHLRFGLSLLRLWRRVRRLRFSLPVVQLWQRV
jgi:hypothetical protein